MFESMAGRSLAGSRPLRAVVTAGGTEEAVDDVRVLTNVSTGRFGAAIARALVRRGIETTVLASRALAARRDELRGPLRVVSFTTFRDLEAALAELTSYPPDLLFMAAAVSDYAPVRAVGKIRSDAPSLEIVLTANPKLLPALRGSLGDRTVLVGFKLLSSVTPEQLVSVARAQALGGRLDLTVANDLAELKNDRHPVWLVPPAGEARRIDGHREDVADAIAEAAVAIARARADGDASAGVNATRPDGTKRAPPSDLGRRMASAADAIGIPASARAIRVRDPENPSHLLDTVEGVDAILMVDEALGRFDAELDGTTSPSDEAVRAALAEAARAGRWGGGPFAVGLQGGAALFGLNDASCEALIAGMRAAREALWSRLGGVSDDERDLIARHTTPIFHGARIVGAAVGLKDDVVAPVVVAGAESHGLGDAVLAQLDAKGCAIAHFGSMACAFDENYARERGFTRGSREMKTLLPPGAPSTWSADGVVLEPPSRTRTLTMAASVALVDPLRRRVLLGKRRMPPFDGYHAFPGGKVEPGESARDCAARELCEETGITLPCTLTPKLVVRVYASDGLRVFAVDCHVFLVLSPMTPTATEELQSEWISIERAREARPMAAGTRRVMRAVEAMIAGR